MILYFFHSGDVMRYSTLYHLLKGKKTTSVLSYGKLHVILEYFNLFPNLTKEQFDKIIGELVEKNLLVQVDKEYVVLSSEGKKTLDNQCFSHYKINEYRYYKYDESFWRMLLFASQVISYKSYKDNDYLPIDNDPIRQLQLKKWLKQVDSTSLVSDFYEEWQQILTVLNEKEQDVLVSQLVGHKVIGYTLHQLAQQENQSMLSLYLLHKSALHQVLDSLNHTSTTYPLFFSLLQLIEQQKEHDTVDLSRHLLSQGYSLEDVARMRRLKESTITDHFIEANMMTPTDQLLTYLSDNVMSDLSRYVANYPDYKQWKYSFVLRDIPSLKFFEFRFYQFYLLEKEEGIQ